MAKPMVIFLTTAWQQTDSMIKNLSRQAKLIVTTNHVGVLEKIKESENVVLVVLMKRAPGKPNADEYILTNSLVPKIKELLPDVTIMAVNQGKQWLRQMQEIGCQEVSDEIEKIPVLIRDFLNKKTTELTEQADSVQ